MIAAASFMSGLYKCSLAVAVTAQTIASCEFYSCITSRFKGVWPVLPGGSGRDTVTAGTDCFRLYANPCNSEIFSVLLFVHIKPLCV